MTVRYEINPPKIGGTNDAQIAKLEDRIEQISNFCDGIHVTESVLGIPRIPPLDIAKNIKEKKPELKVTVSLRTIDKTNQKIHSILDKLIENNIDGVLVLMGDPPVDAKPNSRLFPSRVVEELTHNGYKEKIEIFLSIPNKPNFQKITKKINPTENPAASDKRQKRHAGSWMTWAEYECGHPRFCQAIKRVNPNVDPAALDKCQKRHAVRDK